MCIIACKFRYLIYLQQWVPVYGFLFPNVTNYRDSALQALSLAPFPKYVALTPAPQSPHPMPRCWVGGKIERIFETFLVSGKLLSLLVILESSLDFPIWGQTNWRAPHEGVLLLQKQSQNHNWRTPTSKKISNELSNQIFKYNEEKTTNYLKYQKARDCFSILEILNTPQ